MSGDRRGAKTGEVRRLRTAIEDRARRAAAPRRLARIPIRSLVPNMLTVLALCAGLTAIRLAMQDKFELAVWAILAAAFLDGIDGRVARLLKGTSRFGAELDSLSDFMSFGVAPVVVLYLWTMNGVGGVGWLAALFYAVCCALRLARFNAALEEPAGPSWQAHFFVGMPAPAGACIVVWLLILHFATGWELAREPHIATAFVALIGFLMISRIPTISFKGIRIPREHTLTALVSVAVVTALLTSYPWMFLSALGVLYLGTLPLGVVRYRKLAAREPVSATGPDETGETADRASG